MSKKLFGSAIYTHFYPIHVYYIRISGKKQVVFALTQSYRLLLFYEETITKTRKSHTM